MFIYIHLYLIYCKYINIYTKDNLKQNHEGNLPLNCNQSNIYFVFILRSKLFGVFYICIYNKALKVV